jgi:hypothetical protein
LESGKRFKIKLKVKFNEDIENPTIAIMLNDFNGTLNYGMHSLYSRNPVEVKLAKKDTILEVTCEDEMILTPGIYYLSVSLAKQYSTVQYDSLDSIEELVKVKVYSDLLSWGSINSDAHYKIKEIK